MSAGPRTGEAPGEAPGAHLVVDPCPVAFTWDYTTGARPRLDRLTERALGAQWNGREDLPWATDVDPEQAVLGDRTAATGGLRTTAACIAGTVLERWGDREWRTLAVEHQRWMLSQFLHGEQGALVCTAKIVETVPWLDAKYYAATQVMDEARHVEVFSRYLDEKLAGHYPINPHLGALLDDIVGDARWDMTYLGMQIMVEGLALAAFGFLHAMTAEPLLKRLLRYVMADEARHVAFGVLVLSDVYKELSGPELRERQEFCFEAAVRMRDRLAMQEVWEHLGVPAADGAHVMARSPERAGFVLLLFSRIVPSVKRLGLLDAGDGWLRRRFGELGALDFEDLVYADAEADAEADRSPAARGLA